MDNDRTMDKKRKEESSTLKSKYLECERQIIYPSTLVEASVLSIDNTQ